MFVVCVKERFGSLNNLTPVPVIPVEVAVWLFDCSYSCVCVLCVKKRFGSLNTPTPVSITPIEEDFCLCENSCVYCLCDEYL